MTDRFLTCLPPLLEHEGGNDDDPRDPGGRTSRGITQREYDAYCGLHGLPKGDVWAASGVSLTRIYREAYWLPYCPSLPLGFDYVFFDTAVLQGPQRAIEWMQKALSVEPDGHIGIITMSALKLANVQALIWAVSNIRRSSVRRLKSFTVFGRGWLKRIDEVEQLALQMMREEAPNV